MKGKVSKFFVYAGMFILTFGASSCGQSGVEESSVLDSFEGNISSQTADYGSASNSSVDVTASKDSKCGQQSLMLDYNLAEKGYLYCARGYGLDVLNALWEAPAPDKIDWSKYTGIRLQMKGTQSGQLAFDVKDAGGELWRFMINVDSTEWKEVVIPFDQFSVRHDWQPSTSDGNQKLDFPIRSFQFEPKTVGQGQFYFDCVELDI